MNQKNCVGKLIRVNVGKWVLQVLLPLPFLAQSIPVAAESSAPAVSTPTPSTPIELCAAHNSLQQDDRTILGNLPDSPYVVVVPGRGNELLLRVRECVPDAFQTNQRLGGYIRAGAFPNRRSAEQLSKHLRRSFQLDARVMYLP